MTPAAISGDPKSLVLTTAPLLTPWGRKKPAMALLHAEGADLKRKMRGIVTEFEPK
ncbi:MAG: hypothetical protein ACREEP_13175 [Dongiaceae bacterium]